MTDPRDYKIEVAGVSQSPANARGSSPRPFLSVRFACCGVYQRIYRSATAPATRGRCPPLWKAGEFIVGDGGTEARQFIVY